MTVETLMDASIAGMEGSYFQRIYHKIIGSFSSNPNIFESEGIAPFGKDVREINLENHEKVKLGMLILFESADKSDHYIYDAQRKVWVLNSPDCIFKGFEHGERFLARFGPLFYSEYCKDYLTGQTKIIPGKEYGTDPSYSFIGDSSDRQSIRGIYLSSNTAKSLPTRAHDIFLTKPSIKFSRMLKEIRDWKHSEIAEIFPGFL